MKRHRALCIRSIDTFQEGTFYETYEKGSSRFVRDPQEIGLNYTEYHVSKFDHHFMYERNFVNIPSYMEPTAAEKIKAKILGEEPEKEIVWYKYTFGIDRPTLEKIQRKIFEPIYLLDGSTVFLQYSHTIRYVMDTLLEFVNMQHLVDIDKEIDKASEVLYELVDLQNELEKSVDKKVNPVRDKKINEILKKHHAIMDDFIKAIRAMKESK